VEDARAFYAAQETYLRPIPHSELPEGLPDLRAATCGACHQAIYQEWQVSTHARAWLDDAQFQEELAKATKTPGQDYSWTCVNCHTPLEDQLPRLVAALEGGRIDRPRYVENPHFDPDLQLEAITCATCHVRDGVVLGPYGDTPAPHPVAKAPELLASQVCTQCHQAQAHFPELSLACVFDTGQELARGPYAAEGATCQTCHMPEVHRPLVAGGPGRATRRHWFGGSLIPKHPRFEDELAPLRQVYPDGVSVAWGDLPESCPPGTKVTLAFTATNDEAGHMMPTGDPERFLRLEARVLDPAGTVLAERVEQIGSVYEWDPVRLVSDNRLAPRETRRYELTFTAPAKPGELTLELRASKWRINEKNFQYHHLEGRYVAGRVFQDERTVLPVQTP
jgi:hypothetical protein